MISPVAGGADHAFESAPGIARPQREHRPGDEIGDGADGEEPRRQIDGLEGAMGLRLGRPRVEPRHGDQDRNEQNSRNRQRECGGGQRRV